MRGVAREFAPEAVADYCGIAAAVIRRIARELAAAESAACYGRLGTCVQEFGTLASWGCDLVNMLTGNLDRAGGVMFTTPAAPLDAGAAEGEGLRRSAAGRAASAASPRWRGMIPSSTMAEEMLTPGDGPGARDDPADDQPGAQRRELGAARARRSRSLDFLVAIDFYINETTRHAHIILPTPSPAEQANYEVGLYLLSVRNVAKWSWPVVPRAAGHARDLAGAARTSARG